MKISNWFMIVLLAILLFFISFSTDSLKQKNAMQQPQIFPKSFGEGQLILPKNPQRIISLSPNITEILFALEAGSRIAGVTSYSDFPEEAKQKTSVGEYQSPDIEKIIALHPDLVIGTAETKESTLRILSQAGIPVITVDPKTLPEIITAIDLISIAIGEEERGILLHEQLTSQMNAVQYQLQKSPAKRVFLEIWDAPLLTVGGKSFINDIVLRAGGQNVTAGIQSDYTPSDIEALYAYNPDIYIIVSHNNNNPRSMIVRPELANLAAVQNNQVFQISADILTRPGPRSFQALLQLSGIIHPDITRDGENK